MRITIVGIGSRGDVQPLVALGVGLCRRGHQVQFVAGNEFEALVSDASVPFTPLGINIQERMAAHTNIFRFLKSFTQQILDACDREQDAILATALGVSTCELSRQRGIPFFYALQTPGLRTRAFPDPLMPPLPLGKAYNLLTHRLMEGLIARSYPPLKCLLAEPRPTYLFHFSRHVIARPADWGPFAHITGFWMLGRNQTWQPPADLVDFINGGKPPVYVGFGSTATGDPGQMTALVIEALARAGQRGVLVSGWGGLKRESQSAHVYVADSIPFDWLFPKVALAVHHGGAGTTAAALRAGVPSLVVPFGLDQPFWGRQVQRLGVGPAPIPAKQLTADRLSASIMATLADSSIRARAAELAEKVRNEDGVANAVQIIEQTVASA